MLKNSGIKRMDIFFVAASAMIVSMAQILLALSMKKALEVTLNYTSAKDVYILCIMFAGAIVLNGVGYYFNGIAAAKFKRNAILSLKDRFIKAILRLRIKDYIKIGSGNIVTQFTADINSLEKQYFDVIASIIQDICNFISASVVIFLFNPYIGLSIYILTAILVILPGKAYKQLQSLGFEFSNKTGNIAVKVNEIIKGYEIIKSFGIMERIKNQFEVISNECEEVRYKIGIKEAKVMAGLVITSLLSFVGPFIIGIAFALKGIITVGALMAVINLANSIISPMQRIGSNIGRIKVGKGILNKLYSTISVSNVSDTDNLQKKSISGLKDFIKLENVGFNYDDKTILHSVNLKFEKNRKYLIIGESGAGKSTIIKIIMNYFDDYKGSVYFDDTELKDINEESFSSIITMISQEPFIFNSSLKDNIVLNSEWSGERFDKVCHIAAVDRFAEKLSSGINTQLGDGREQLSGGEKQRVAIARALYKNTDVLLIDEATASLDKDNSRMINEIILGLNKTVIYIAHKMESDLINEFDDVITLSDGKVLNNKVYDTGVYQGA